MKNFRFWIPVIIGMLATPIFLGVALISTGAGHGSYLSTLIFYPLPLFLLFLQPVNIDDAFLKAILDNGIIAVAFGLAILQFPAYGFLISYSRTKTGSKLWTAIRIILGIHIIVCLALLPYAIIARA